MTAPPTSEHDVVDFHTHVDEAPTFGWFDPPSTLVPALDEAGVAVAVTMTYRDATAEDPSPLEYVKAAAAAHPGRLLALARLAPSQDGSAAELLEHAVRDLGCVGLKLHPVSTLQPPGGDPTVRLVEKAAELDVPVLVHCGDELMTTPLALERLAVAVPRARVVLAHMGGYFHVDEAIGAARRRPNILLETSAMPYPHRIREAVEAIGRDRVLFGSDGPGARPHLEVQKVLQSGLDGADLTAVLGGSARRLLGLAA